MNRKQRRATRKGQTTPAERRLAAGHEAAHGLVAIRLGLPLASVDIRRRRRAARGATGTVNSMGYAGLAVGTVQSWVDRLPDPEARTNLIASAAVSAAGVVVETRDGGFPFGHESQHDDIEAMVQMASVLGIGTSSEEPAVQEFIANAIQTAQAALVDSDGTNRIWSGITGTLYGDGELSGDRVHELIAEEPEAEER